MKIDDTLPILFRLIWFNDLTKFSDRKHWFNTLKPDVYLDIAHMGNCVQIVSEFNNMCVHE